MPFPLEYHVSVRRFVPASVALFGLLALPEVLVSASQAQINGVPASVTSPGFGGRAVNGAPSSVTSPGFGGRAINGTQPSVTSLGPHGHTSTPGVTFSTSTTSVSRRDGHHHHHHFVEYVPPVIYAPIPYAIDISATDEGYTPDDDDAEDQGGPTIFDRRGLGEESYVPPVSDLRPHKSAQDDNDETTKDDPPATEPQEPTLLVFKDGHKIEVGNYAIVGSTLFDLTPGHTRKVAVADLDLDATEKQNDDRGVVFSLPQPAQAN